MRKKVFITKYHKLIISFQTSDGQQQYIVLEITQLNEGEEAVQQESKVQQVLQSSSSTSGRKLNL